MAHRQPKTFADKFEQALKERKKTDPKYGLRTLARTLAGEDERQAEIVRRRLHKYRPRPGGGSAEVTPTEPTRREIEAALGLEQDSLAPDADLVVARGRSIEDLLLARIREIVEDTMGRVTA
jgi:hypothetical protein